MSVPWKSGGGVDGQLFEHVTMVFIALLMRSFVLDINGKIHLPMFFSQLKCFCVKC